jgi:hypothetical protein
MNRMAWAFVGLVGVAGGGCNCVGREFAVQKTFTVDSHSDLCATAQKTINLQDDSAFSQMKGNLGKVELRKVTVVIGKPQAESVATVGHGSVSVQGTSEGSVVAELGTYADVPISEGSRQDIEFDRGAAGQLADLALKPPNSFEVIAQGCNDRVPALYDFDVILTLYAELKLF